MSVTRIPVATELKPEDRYDVIFVVMRYTQVGEMSALNRDLKLFFDKQGTAYPVWLALEKDTGNYLEQV